MLREYFQGDYTEVFELGTSERGTGGFGSTGIAAH